MSIALNVIMAILLLLAISLRRAYQSVPPKELKRRAREGDKIATGLYRAAGYGHSLNAVLWFLVIVASTGLFVSISRSTPLWAALVIIGFVLWFCFIWSPTRQARIISLRVAHTAAPLLARLLNYVHPVVDRIAAAASRHWPVTIHTGLYDKKDMIDLLEKQRVQADNRIDQFELEVALHAITFGDYLVRDCLVPRRVVKAVDAAESVGPVLMTELHASGYSRFPVYEGKSDNIIGTLLLRDLVDAKATGQVRDLMRKGVCYLHEEQSLAEALQAILKTRQHLFVVVNSFEEYVGIITIEDILEQVIGNTILDEFDQYEDMRAVATRQAQVQHKAHTQTGPHSEIEPVP